MEAIDLLSDLAAAGITLEPEGDQLRIEGPLTSELRELIRQNVSDLGELVDLKQAAGDDWASIVDNPAALAAWANLRHTMQLRDRGQVPGHWTKEFDCPRCGPVMVEPSWPNHVDHCPWCHNRLQGRPVPGYSPPRVVTTSHVSEVATWILDHLSDGMKLSAHVIQAGIEAGYPESTLIRARDEIGTGLVRDHDLVDTWYWATVEQAEAHRANPAKITNTPHPTLHGDFRSEVTTNGSADAIDEFEF